MAQAISLIALLLLLTNILTDEFFTITAKIEFNIEVDGSLDQVSTSRNACKQLAHELLAVFIKSEEEVVKAEPQIAQEKNVDAGLMRETYGKLGGINQTNIRRRSAFAQKQDITSNVLSQEVKDRDKITQTITTTNSPMSNVNTSVDKDSISGNLLNSTETLIAENSSCDDIIIQAIRSIIMTLSCKINLVLGYKNANQNLKCDQKIINESSVISKYKDNMFAEAKKDLIKFALLAPAQVDLKTFELTAVRDPCSGCQNDKTFTFDANKLKDKKINIIPQPALEADNTNPLKFFSPFTNAKIESVPDETNYANPPNINWPMTIPSKFEIKRKVSDDEGSKWVNVETYRAELANREYEIIATLIFNDISMHLEVELNKDTVLRVLI